MHVGRRSLLISILSIKGSRLGGEIPQDKRLAYIYIYRGVCVVSDFHFQWAALCISLCLWLGGVLQAGRLWTRIVVSILGSGDRVKLASAHLMSVRRTNHARHGLAKIPTIILVAPRISV